MRAAALDRAALVWGVAFTVVGVTFFLEELGVWQVRAEVFLPVLLIIAGVVLVGSGFLSGEPSE